MKTESPIFHIASLDEICAFIKFFSSIYPRKNTFFFVCTFNTKYGQIDCWLN